MLSTLSVCGRTDGKITNGQHGSPPDQLSRSEPITATRLMRNCSNTLRRKIFQEELKSAFEDADEVLFAPVHRAEALPNAERLDVAAVVEELRSRGKEAHLFSGVKEIVSHAAGRLKGGDTALIMSNGGFEGIHDLLLQALRERPSPNSPAGFASSKPASPERS